MQGRTDSPDRLDSLGFTLGQYGRTVRRLPFPVREPDRAAAWKAAARGRLLELLGPFPDATVALEPRYGPVVDRGRYTRQAVTFRTRPDLEAFGYLLVPAERKGRLPGMLCLPGHGRGVDEIVGIDAEGRDRDDPDGYQHDFAVQCAKRGYVTLALEMLGFGHRRDPAAHERGAEASSCQPAAGAALMLGETMAGWRTWDAMRALDLLATRPEVDPERLALMGISGGGTVGLYTAALDERVQAAVLSGSFCTFRDSIFSVSHCIDNYVPGILKWFEMPDLAGLVAPRYLFCESGTEDDIFPKAGVEAALEQARALYATAGVPDHVDSTFFEGGHQFDGRAAFERLARWLGH